MPVFFLFQRSGLERLKPTYSAMGLAANLHECVRAAFDVGPKLNLG